MSYVVCLLTELQLFTSTIYLPTTLLLLLAARQKELTKLLNMNFNRDDFDLTE